MLAHVPPSMQAAAATKCLRFLEKTRDACERRLAASMAHKPEHLWMMQLPVVQQASHEHEAAGTGRVHRALLSLGLLGQCFLDIASPLGSCCVFVTTKMASSALMPPLPLCSAIIWHQAS